MRLSEFIRENPEPIIAEWETFAGTLNPASEATSPLSLRNHINFILEFIADDIDSPQTEAEQIRKSHGEKAKHSKDSVAEVHAALRQAGGFNMDQMVSEYRALRASVVKLWGAEASETTPQDIVDLTRFNEAIDQELTESISYYSSKVEHSRNLFLGILGHDLRNPIGAMTMSAELIGRIGSLSERQTMLVSQISLSSARAMEILNQLLDLTRARLGSGLKVIRKKMDMAFVARLLVDEMRAAHPECAFTVNASGNTEGQWDRPRIGQVFSNLLGNAVQYGFKDLPINVAIKGEADDVIVSVHNDGVPISPGAMVGIFDALVRSAVGEQAHLQSNNLGLGLYITKEIVSAHGGTIKVTSSEKDGTVFTAIFPRA
ncbi:MULTISPECIES: HAMP domain-containing sensor histidine kinase [Rhodopseudomonas]|uniref:histidine kinase n=1 Tax=Rhodopseudomonas palustris TaxID=1076 RepID=A0A0D7F855_RHOPL|nr:MULTISPECIES: HAMP domain-containing sensor histidine kinase [Rhodopseudomonas]KIZ47897.1 histidine kinase [Rhodopseudomonas palustris]MDF3810720.1 HAMP domain-containing sensor histidine kinase [Rhodopseudomonas sp. BAL398]WOK20526.1 HAMP domain-containing sensor histidine kinase [Rhodopseudomonas sp. BAL398]